MNPEYMYMDTGIVKMRVLNTTRVKQKTVPKPRMQSGTLDSISVYCGLSHGETVEL